MSHGPSRPRVTIAGQDGTPVDVAQSGERTVLLVLDPESKATLGAIMTSLQSIEILLALMVGGRGDS